MKSTYQPRRYPSPIQPRFHPAKALKNQVMDVREKKNPLRSEIEKCVGAHALVAEVIEDTQTVASMNIEGLVAFLCILKKGGKVISQGRGSAILNPATRYMSRAVHSAFNSAIADSIIRATKVLGTLIEPEAKQSNATGGEAYPMRGDSELATEKQRKYLAELITLNVMDEDERERQQSQLSEITKFEASRMIESFRR